MMDSKTVIYYADVSPLEDSGLFAAYYLSAPPQRREKIDRLRREDARRLSLGAWSLLAAAIEARGVSTECDIAFGDKGKPYFRDIPDLHFSLSHSGSIAMCALSDKEIGCDAELIAGPRFSVAERFFSAEEREYLRGVSPEDIARAFYKIWTRKESFLKATGLGFTVPAYSFSAADGAVKTELFPGEWSVFDIDISGGYAAACCVRGKTAPEVFSENVRFDDYFADQKR